MPSFTAVYLAHCLNEDIPHGDITSAAVCRNESPRARAVFLAKRDLVLSGTALVRTLLARHFPQLTLDFKARDGGLLTAGKKFGAITGPIRDILACERVCLNFLQRLSGIATLTARFATLAKPYRTVILDTRKTTPGWRAWEKQAVLHGGGKNHRMNLSDQYLIKDNHIAAAGSAELALSRVLEHKRRTRSRALVEIEVTDLLQLRAVLPMRPDIVLLDNMTPKRIRTAVKIRDDLAPRVKLEISGGVTLANIRAYLKTGVDRISIGALTHSALAADISLEMA